MKMEKITTPNAPTTSTDKPTQMSPLETLGDLSLTNTIESMLDDPDYDIDCDVMENIRNEIAKCEEDNKDDHVGCTSESSKETIVRFIQSEIDIITYIIDIGDGDGDHNDDISDLQFVLKVITDDGKDVERYRAAIDKIKNYQSLMFNAATDAPELGVTFTNIVTMYINHLISEL